MTRALVTGAFGQIGTELVEALRQKHGPEQVVVTGRRPPPDPVARDGPHAVLDVTDGDAIVRVFETYRPAHVYHLAAQLSATGEQQPQQAWTVNMGGLYHVLEAARRTGVRQIFWPSSIAAFGPGTPMDATPQDTVMRPTTIYGVAKVAGELLCDYYDQRYDLSVRGVRYPGVISHRTLPGGGTTDYAVEIFYAALRTGRYTCFVRPDTVLPMIYMPDCLKAAIDLMDADPSRLVHRNGFNVAAMSFSAQELADEIAKHVPGFVCDFEPDARQAIADSWPRSVDDSCARREWGWAPRFRLADMTVDMLEALRTRQQAGHL